MAERRFNEYASIIDGPPYKPVDHDRLCPARLRVDGDPRSWVCQMVVRAGRTKHRNVHDWIEEEARHG